MIPSWNSVEDITVNPFHLRSVKLPDFCELLLRIPTTVDEDLVTSLRRLGEYTASTSAFRATINWVEFFPGLGLEVKGVDIIEVLPLVVETTVTTENDDLAFENARTHISSWAWGTNIRFLVI